MCIMYKPRAYPDTDGRKTPSCVHLLFMNRRNQRPIKNQESSHTLLSFLFDVQADKRDDSIILMQGLYSY